MACAQPSPTRPSVKQRTAEIKATEAAEIEAAQTPTSGGSRVEVGELSLELPSFANWQTAGAQSQRGIRQVLYEGATSSDGRYRLQAGFQRANQAPRGGVAQVPDTLPYDQVDDYARLSTQSTSVAGTDECQRFYYRSTTRPGWLANQFCVQGGPSSTLAAQVVLESDGAIGEAEFRRRADALFDTIEVNSAAG